MAFLSGLSAWLRKIDPSRIAAIQATLAGDYGAVAQLASRRQQMEAERDAAKAAHLAEARRHEAAGALGISKDQINAMLPEDLSRLIFERSRVGQIGSGVSAVGASSHEPAQGHEEVEEIVVNGRRSSAPPPIYQGSGPIQMGGALDGILGDTGITDAYGVDPATGIPSPLPGIGPAPGMVIRGYRFRGGNPNSRRNWEPE